jgi:putative tryptophan/tyrosine transport system substrate-binding protein
MRRREFITLLGATAAAWPLAARGQQPDRVRRVGVLMAYAESDSVAQAAVVTFRDGLAKLGWRDGSNLRIELRWGAGDAEKFKAFAKELVNLRPDAILSMGTVATGFAVRETQTIPIVFVSVGDPISSGLVANLARPSGNVTGFMLDLSSQGGKWVQLLKEIAPRTVHLALLANPATAPSSQLFVPSIQAAASTLAIEVSFAPVQAKEEIEGVIAAQAREPGGGLIVLPSAFSSVNRDLIVALAAQYLLPAMYYERTFTDLGGLIVYSPDYFEGFRPAAGYIDRILKGAKPGDLPVQAPTTFELFINLKTAKALGLTIPQTLLATANVIE